jgi:hypothetical protein
MSKVASGQGINFTDLDQETLLKQAKVRCAIIPHISDDFKIEP